MKNYISLVGLLVIIAFSGNISAMESGKHYARGVRAFKKDSIKSAGTIPFVVLQGGVEDLMQNRLVGLDVIPGVEFYIIDGNTYIDARKFHDNIKKARNKQLNLSTSDIMYFMQGKKEYAMVNREDLRKVPGSYAPLIKVVEFAGALGTATELSYVACIPLR